MLAHKRFFTSGHQLHNVMIALSALNDVGDEPVAAKRVAHAIKSSAVPVTITMLCHVITFSIGLWSGYKVVRIFSTYTGKFKQLIRDKTDRIRLRPFRMYPKIQGLNRALPFDKLFTQSMVQYSTLHIHMSSNNVSFFSLLQK